MSEDNDKYLTEDELFNYLEGSFTVKELAFIWSNYDGYITDLSLSEDLKDRTTYQIVENAILDKKLPFKWGKNNEKLVKGHDFKAFIQKYYPERKTYRLFTEAEMNNEKEPSKEELKEEIRQLKEEINSRENGTDSPFSYREKEKNKEIEKLQADNEQLKQHIKNLEDQIKTTPSIYTLADVLLDIAMGITGRNRPFHSREEIKNHIMEKFPNTHGLSRANLDSLFSNIKKRTKKHT